MRKSEIVKQIVEHIDRDEIIAKSIAGVDPKEIAEWLEAKYDAVGERKFVLTAKSISIFQKDYLDVYKIIQEDLQNTKANLTAEEELKIQIQGNPTYHKSLEKYIDNEIDIKAVVKKLVCAIETRAAQVFDQIQEDPENIRMDRTLVEWFNTLINVLEKYDLILNGSPDQINIQNNINIQVVDDHINVVYNIIREILAKLDYETSILFIDMFNEEMKKLKSTQPSPLSQEDRLASAKILEEKVFNKMS